MPVQNVPEELAWIDYAHSVLARAGLRRGGVRERIIELLDSEPCALSAVEIEDGLRAHGARVGRASIYRVLDLLLEHGLVERVSVGRDLARFERALPSGEHHHHLVCDRCGRLVAFDDPGLERAIHKVSERLRARVEHHDVTLRGACADCD